MRSNIADWISLVEAGYCQEGDDQQWIDHVFDCARPLFDPASLPDVWTYSVTPASFTLGLGRTSPAWNRLREKVHKTIPSTAIDIVYRTGWVVATGSECIPLWTIKQMEFFQMIGQMVGTTVSDALGIKCSTGTASGIVFAVLLTERPASHGQGAQTVVSDSCPSGSRTEIAWSGAGPFAGCLLGGGCFRFKGQSA
jgi:hypothetical protein